ncbi:MAG: class I tRNA ligase family protein, partial [Candidatus Diapherotrites archaeon]|nr:class I tRNA ligase family protein [Candidatus Diapherotrites archaeon]
YINSPVHMGHASTYTIMDFIARFRRMLGQEVLFPLGLDQNGLPIEISAEKKYNVDFTKISREEAIGYCRRLLDATTAESIDSFFKSGIGFSSWKDGENISDIYQTDSPTYRALTQSTFIDLWKKGLIYEDNKVVNWDPKLQTTVADAEIEYEDRPGFFHDIVFKEKESGEEVIIATTRPELLCTCGMVIYHPDDDRYKHLEGKTLITPYFKIEVPVKAHPIAEIDKGTGIMMMCSYGDLNDIRFFIEQKIKGAVAINGDGTLNENAGDLAGLTIKEGREKIVEALEKQGLLKDKTPTQAHRTPISERSGAAIEFIEMKEFYLKQLDYKDKMKEIAKKINIYSPKSRQILLDWIESVSIDWPISRRRYYATEVPMWKCTKCNEYVLAEKGKYVQPWKDKYEGTCKCGSTEFVGEERVFDTWFDSSISPLYILGYERNPAFFAKHNVCSLRPQGKEIVRTWLYYTLLKDYLLTDKIIFDDVWIHHHIVDEKGYKFAKRRGNGIDPHDVIKRFGAAPFRLWCALEGNLDKSDFRCSFQRIEGTGKVLDKFWNVSKFVSMFELNKDEKDVELMEIDKWILSEVDALAKDAQEKFMTYDFHNPAVRIMNFIKDEFASNYLEIVKRRAYNNDENVKFSEKERNGAVQTLRNVLKTILEITYPIEPAMNYYIYKELFGKEIQKQAWPKSGKEASEIVSEELMEFNSAIWKAKKDNELSLKDGVKSVIAPKSLAKAEKELKAMHGIEEISFSGKETKVTVK